LSFKAKREAIKVKKKNPKPTKGGLQGTKKLKNVSKRKNNKVVLCLKPTTAGRD